MLSKQLHIYMALLSIAFLKYFPSHATDIEFNHRAELPTLSAKRNHISARYIEEGDQDIIEELAKQSYLEGLPSDPLKWAENHIERRNNKNYYSCLLIQDQNKGQSIAALGFGRMPVLNYDPKYNEIIDTYVQFGVIRQISFEEGYARNNFERIDNWGVGFFLPIIPSNLEKNDKVAILQLGYDVFQKLQQEGKLLPVENTLPHDVVSLLHPQDKIVEDFIDIGFNVLDKSGFFGFYDKPRVMVHKTLSS